MSDLQASRFTPQNKTTNERLSTHTVGLVALSDFRKRRAAVLEEQEREAREAALSGTSKPDRSLTGTPDNAGSDSVGSAGPGPLKKGPPKKKKKKTKTKQNPGRKLLSFGGDEDGGDDTEDASAASDPPSDKDGPLSENRAKFKANAAVGLAPKAVTKAALRKEAAERETLRREFVALQESIKDTEIAMPFVFYDGANTLGGTVRMKKGDFVWVFLDKSRKVGAELGVGEQTNTRRGWARVGVDDLMLVRGTVIIPHHYDFYYFVVNKTTGPGGTRIFDYSAEAPTRTASTGSDPDLPTGVLVTAAAKAAAAKARQPDVSTLEGFGEDPTLTKVVDRRWYERHKHIYPASTWQEFDPEMDYSTQIRKDNGGNTFFFSK
ncbi:XAP5 domain-containing protein [Trichoderma ceciliae]